MAPTRFMSTSEIAAFNFTAQDIHDKNVQAGWWKDSITYGGNIPDAYMIPTKMALSHSEISEGLEGLRKGLMDDHLSQYPMVQVEIADAIIRLLDKAGYFTSNHGYAPIGEVIAAKRAYNHIRADHKQEVRDGFGGKSI